MQRTPDSTTRYELPELVKDFGPYVAWIPVLGISVPVIDAYVEDDWLWAVVIGSLVPIGLAFRGFQAMGKSATTAANTRTVVYGGVVISIFLVLAPESIRLAVANVSQHPTWIAFSLAGVAVGIGYLWFAFRRIRGTGLSR